MQITVCDRCKKELEVYSNYYRKDNIDLELRKYQTSKPYWISVEYCKTCFIEVVEDLLNEFRCEENKL